MEGGCVQHYAVQQPAQPQRPPDRRVSAQAAPAEHQVGAESFAGHEAGEEDHHRSDYVPCYLQHGDLADDLERGEVRQRACSGRAPSGHGGARAGVLGSRERVLSVHRGLEGKELSIQRGGHVSVQDVK